MTAVAVCGGGRPLRRPLLPGSDTRSWLFLGAGGPCWTLGGTGCLSGRPAPFRAGVCLCARAVNILLIKENCPQEQCLSTERGALTETGLFSRGEDVCGGKRQKFLQIMVLCKCIKRIIPYKKESGKPMCSSGPGDRIPDEPPFLRRRRF